MQGGYLLFEKVSYSYEAMSVPLHGEALYCAQRTDEVPDSLERLLCETGRAACELKGRLALGNDWVERWCSLSHGERKQVQIRRMPWLKPDILAFDEPANHLDLPSIKCLEEALEGCPCGLLLVSHDLRLLSSLTRSRWHRAPTAAGFDGSQLLSLQ